PRITAVNHLFTIRHETFDHSKLFFHPPITDQLNPKRRGNNGKITQLPGFPVRVVIVWFFQRTEMPEGPGNAIPPTFVVTVHTCRSTQHLRDVFRYTGFFRNTKSEFSHTVCWLANIPTNWKP